MERLTVGEVMLLLLDKETDKPIVMTVRNELGFADGWVVAAGKTGSRRAWPPTTAGTALFAVGAFIGLVSGILMTLVVVGRIH
jgi:hypothetical protein